MNAETRSIKDGKSQAEDILRHAKAWVEKNQDLSEYLVRKSQAIIQLHVGNQTSKGRAESRTSFA